MKNVYRVTRPAWAAMDRSETALILAASVVLGIYGGWGQPVATAILTPLRLPPGAIPRFWPLLDVIIVTVGCLLLILCYKKLRVGSYPSTFIYCFNMPEASNPNGNSQVVGYLHIRPEMKNGELSIVGASFFWDSGLDTASRVGFTSTQVYSTQENGETTCHIRFTIDKDDSAKRLYRHGLLQFRLVHTQSQTVTTGDREAYAGYLQSMHRGVEIQEVGVQSKGYAEWWGKGIIGEDEIQAALRRQGDVLFAKLNAPLNAIPAPTLWRRVHRPAFLG